MHPSIYICISVEHLLAYAYTTLLHHSVFTLLHRDYKANVAQFFESFDSMCNNMLPSSSQKGARKKTAKEFEQIKLVDKQRQAAMQSR